MVVCHDQVAERDQSTFTELVNELTEHCITDLQKARSVTSIYTVTFPLKIPPAPLPPSHGHQHHAPPVYVCTPHSIMYDPPALFMTPGGMRNMHDMEAFFKNAPEAPIGVRFYILLNQGEVYVLCLHGL